MNRWQLIAITVGITVGITAMILYMYQKGMLPASKDNNGITKVEQTDGAEIEMEEGADGFACSCGCSSGNEMEDCQCNKCGEMKEEKESQEEKYYYEDPDTGEMVEIPIDTSVYKPMDKSAVKELVDVIKKTDSLCVRRCESLIEDDGNNNPKFTAISESRYFYDAKNNKVLNAEGEDISEKAKFSITGCKDSYGFLKSYFNSRGLSSDFVTEDLSHTRDLLLGQRVYSYGVDGCEEIKNLEEKMDGIDITERDCSYQVKTYEDGVDRIMYITITVAGKNSDGATVVRYITYILEYNPSLPSQEVAA